MARSSGRGGDTPTAPEAPKAARRRPVPKAKAASGKAAAAVATPPAPSRAAGARKPGPQGAAGREKPAVNRSRPKAALPSAAVAPPARTAAEPEPPAPPKAEAARLTEEEQIESAKYLPREMPPRLFEEERFLFPETYGVNRVRLLVKDPEWLFAHWDFDPSALDSLRASLGERAMAVSSLTLRISDPGNGGSSVIYLPTGARSWYVKTDSARRSYRAELGLTLPSGEFRSFATSNTVATPRTGTSPEPAKRVISYKQAAEITAAAAAEVAVEQRRAVEESAGPWTAPPQMASSDAGGAEGVATAGRSSASKPGAKTRGKKPERGGASDTYRR